MATNHDLVRHAGGHAIKSRTVTAAASVVEADSLVLADATSDAFTVTLPSIADAYDSATNTGQRVTIKKIDGEANTVTVDATADETIDGGANVTLTTQFAAVTLEAGPDEWHVVSGAGTVSVTAIGYPIQRWSSTVLFSDLGSGASDAITLASQAGASAFPTDVLLLGVVREVDVQFAGEADLADELGDAGEADADAASATLHGVAVGGRPHIDGAQSFPRFEAAYDPLATFSATELDDVSAGSITYHYYYITPALG